MSRHRRALILLTGLMVLAATLARIHALAADDIETTFPSPLASLLLPSQALREISVGEDVHDTLTFHGQSKFFELTAPSDGTLVVRVSWQPEQGSLELVLADTHFGYELPIIGKLRVVAGQQYLLAVEDAIPWDYDDLFLPFELTTSIEDDGSDDGTSCPTARPDANWVCVNGGWVPPDHPLAGTSGGGGGSAGGTAGGSSGGSDGSTTCSTPQPVASWICVGGGWVPPDHPLAGAAGGTSGGGGATGGGTGSGSGSGSGGSTNCTTPQPGANWVCVNGGWVPPNHPLAGGGGS